MNSEEAKQLMLRADLVITNPPFSKDNWAPFFIWLNDEYVDKHNKNYFIFGPMIIIKKTDKSLLKKVKYVYGNKNIKDGSRPYKRPDGSIKKVATNFYCSWKVPHMNLKEVTDEYYNGIPVYDRAINVPDDYYDWMYVPNTFIRYIYLEDYEIDYEDEGVPGAFYRIKIKKKGK